MCCLRKGKINLSIVIKQLNVRGRAKTAVAQASNICLLKIYSGPLSDFPSFLQENVKLKIIHVFAYTCENIPIYRIQHKEENAKLHLNEDNLIPSRLR